MYTRTVSELVLTGQQRANRENDGAITEWKSWLSTLYGQLYNAVAGTGCRYFETEAALTLPSPCTLPTNHLATLGVSRLVDSGGRRRPLTKAMASERAVLLGRRGTATKYGVRGQTVELYAAPTSGTYYLEYIPQPAKLSSAGDSDAVDVITADGEDYIAWGMALFAWSKGEDDVRLADGKQKEALANVLTWAAKYNFTHANHHVLAPGVDPHWSDE